jgi:hypothetical protein
MSHLYNLRSTARSVDFTITKFDDDLNPIEGSSYIVSETGCTCLQGHKPTCRHRKMLPYFLSDPKKVARLDTGWFLDWDTRQWKDPTGIEYAKICDRAEEILSGETASHAGEGPGPSTLAAANFSSPSASGRGQPAPASPIELEITQNLIIPTPPKLKRRI